MANTKREKLFTQFPEVSTEQWEQVITADLKGADYERKLVWRTTEGFNVRPYYRAENLEGINFLGSAAGEFPYVRGTHANNRWLVHQTLTVSCPAAANAEALKVLMSGVDSVGFCIKTEKFDAADLDTLLSEIDLSAVEITFCGKHTLTVAKLMLAKLEAAQIEPKKAHICFCIDPLVKCYSTSGKMCESFSYKMLAEVFESYKEYKHVRVVNVSAQTFGNSGSTIVEELAFMISAGHDYLVNLMEAGLSVDLAARKIRFSTSISSNYFMEIAKIRAARMMWANVVKGYNPVKNCAGKMLLHAMSSFWNMTAYDPYVNMLRGTTEAMSAALAGVHSFEVMPFDVSFEESTDFSKRIARNAQLLLKHEAHFDQVVDPAGGSYYIENLTQSIAAEAWALFLEVEQKGGYTAAFEQGFIVDRIKASAAAKDKSVATRRKILLGANQYPNFTEVADKAITTESVTRQSSEGNVLTPYRGSMAFEAMRLETDRSGKAPLAFMLTCGNLGMARARAQFACNFFACAGIKVQDNTYFKSVEEGVAAAKAAGASIVVICSSDDDYATLAPQAKELLAGSAILTVAGAPACTEELQAQGITNFINVKSNVLETLKFYLKELGI